MPTATGTRVIKALSREECLTFLAENNFGRLVLNLRSEVPLIRPVNYIFDRRTESVIFRTDFGSKFQALILATRAAFEIDDIDNEQRTGWSVIVSGRVERVTNWLELERLKGLGLDSWAPGEKPHVARIRAWTVSGRCIGDRTGNRPTNRG